ncbi:MAG: hypothetical protein H6955_19240 [Chromatiaceae bacterium]|nr:hypothetical protein [Chromatiaceae bacterium]
MNLERHLLEGLKLAALLAAVAWVVWSMPEHDVAQALRDAGKPTASR